MTSPKPVLEDGEDEDEDYEEEEEDYELEDGGGEEPFPGVERQEGDGQETPTPVDDDEDKKNPQYIPKKGMFYEHDNRRADPYNIASVPIVLLEHL